jgi:hypothetical protein
MRESLLREAAIVVSVLFSVALIYMFEYSIALNLTFEADKKARTLSQASGRIEKLRIKDLKLASYRSALGGE